MFSLWSCTMYLVPSALGSIMFRYLRMGATILGMCRHADPCICGFDGWDERHIRVHDVLYLARYIHSCTSLLEGPCMAWMPDASLSAMFSHGIFLHDFIQHQSRPSRSAAVSAMRYYYRFFAGNAISAPRDESPRLKQSSKCCFLCRRRMPRWRCIHRFLLRAHLKPPTHHACQPGKLPLLLLVPCTAPIQG